MLKKQTVWLLTMLSLMIVLSVYYMMSPKNEDHLAYIDDGKNATQETTSDTVGNDGDDVDVDISDSSRDGLFAMIRMELDDKRSMSKSRLKDIVAASNATSDEKNQALNEINKMEELATKETILEESILSKVSNYQDVLVRSNGEKVQVQLIVDTLSDEEVVNIMQMAKDEFGEIPVVVDFQPAES